jgi:protein-tyrosine-phosphatase
MAEALLRRHTAGQVKAISAGTHPRPRMHANTVRVLHSEFGIDIAGQRPRRLSPLTGRRFDYVITLCDKAREACPEFADHPHRVHWSIADPASGGDRDQPGYPAFARTAADIDARVRHLLPVLGSRPTMSEGSLRRDRTRPVRQRSLPG